MLLFEYEYHFIENDYDKNATILYSYPPSFLNNHEY